jgi:hypothetical protein
MDLIRFIFACFGIFANTIYSHHSLHIRFKKFAQIRIHMIDLMQKILVASNIHLRANIRLRFAYTGECLLQNIGLEAKFAQLYADLTFKRIFASKYSQTSEYSLANIRLQIFAYQKIIATQCFKLFRKSFHKS